LIDQPPVVRPLFKFVHADTLTGAKVRVCGHLSPMNPTGLVTDSVHETLAREVGVRSPHLLHCPT
jgi:hypothetical protein